MNTVIVRLICLGLVLVASPLTAAVVDGIGEITVRDDSGDGTFFTVDFEGNYLPNVVRRENGAASFEALKVQAVAARTFAYYKLRGDTFIRNGTSDQVYSLGGVQPNPGGLWEAAVRATEGEILSFNGILTATFYVAGAIPSNSSAVATGSDPDPTNTERFVTYTFANDRLGPNNTGTTLGFVGTPSNPNYPNRGAMSQNGSDRLSDDGAFYQNILKFYYGGDIQLGLVNPLPGQPPMHKTLTGFEAGNEHFARAINFAGQTRNLGAGSSAEVSQQEAQEGSSSQKITIDYDAAGDRSDNGVQDGFTVRHLSGVANGRRLSNITNGAPTNPAGDPVGNLVLPTEGSIGFWLLAEPVASDANLRVAITIDEWQNDVANADLEQSTYLDIIADGQWHQYQWSLNNDSLWLPAFGASSLGDGVLGQNMTVDSIVFRGQSDAVIYLDSVFYSSVVAVPEPSTTLGLLTLGIAAVWRRRRTARG
ncbi:SpoIID/LytB domain-containing protein [Rubripirellula lacrimiformis]|nr:SpoIID/LytB domain-containing protein [Rubripirellula lacrimiformis]